MAVRIIAGSTSDIPAKLKDRVIIVPLTVSFGDKEYIDGVTIKNDDFYRMLENSEISPVTSQPSPAAFRERYEEVVRNGDTAVVLTVSSKLSGTYQSAMLGRDGMEDKIFVVDTKTAAIAEAVLCEYALRLVDEGKSAGEIAEILEGERDNVTVIALLDTLEYLVRGGRISKTAGMFGKLLSVKAVITAKDGLIMPLGKARGIKNGKNLLALQIDRAGGIDFDMPYLVGYTGTDDSVIKQYLEETRNIWEGHIERPNYVCMGSVIGTHAGPGCLAVAFFNKER